MAITLGAIWGLWRFGRRRPEVLPDLLAQTAGNDFERDGLCFAFRPTVTSDRHCWMHVFFQNRFERPCRGQFVLRAPTQRYGKAQLPLPSINVSLDCDGAAFGVYRIPWPVPAPLQGILMTFDVTGAARYPNGRGQMLRFREGIRVGSASSDLGRWFLTIAALLGGGIYVSRPAKTQFHLPVDVADEAALGAVPSGELLWWPGLPTGGSPIAPPE